MPLCGPAGLKNGDLLAAAEKAGFDAFLTVDQGIEYQQDRQAVRLPAEFRFEGEEVFIRKDEKTGDVILSRRPASWDEFFRLRDEALKVDPRAATEFLTHRNDPPPEERELFGS